MSKLKWDLTGERTAEAGVSWGVLFPFTNNAYDAGVAWSGLTSVSESPTGGEPNPFYADNKKYIEVMSEEEFAGSIGCYTYPDEFKACIGEKAFADGVFAGQQTHAPCGLAYRTEIINDTKGVEYGFKIHLVYGMLVGVSEREHTSINESPDLEELSFEFTTTKVDVATEGFRPTAHLIIDSTKIKEDDAAKFQTFLDTIFGKDAIPAIPAIPEDLEADPPVVAVPEVPEVPAIVSSLPTPDAVAAIFA